MQCKICEEAPAEVMSVLETIDAAIPSSLVSAASEDTEKRKQLDGLSKILTSAIKNHSSLSSNPAELIAFMTSSMTKMAALVAPKDQVKLLNSISAKITKLLAASSNAALKRYLKTFLVTSEAKALATVSIKTSAEAETYKDDIAGKIDDLLLDTPDDATFQALQDVKSAVCDSLSERGMKASQVGTYTVREPRSAIALAQTIYGDASRADELVERNDIGNPALVPSGTVLEVLL